MMGKMEIFYDHLKWKWKSLGGRAIWLRSQRTSKVGTAVIHTIGEPVKVEKDVWSESI